MTRPTLLAAATAAALAATAVLAQSAPPAPPPATPRSLPTGAASDGHDANELICRSQAAIGSRLARQRVCATRQQWLDQRRADRDLAEKAQTNRTWCKEGMPC